MVIPANTRNQFMSLNELALDVLFLDSCLNSESFKDLNNGILFFSTKIG